MYAVWTRVTYTVTYLSNTSKVISGLPTQDSGILPGTDYTIWNKSVPSGDGYTFIEWNTQADGNGIKYKPGDKIILNQNLTFYAIWNINGHKLFYDKNTSDSVSNMPDTETHEYNTSFTIAQRLPNREGYTLIGWSNTPGGTTVTNEIGSIYTMPAQDITLYAVWKINDYSIIYDKNSDTDEVSNMPNPESHRYRETFNLSRNVPARTGYTFLGWSENPSASTASYASGASFITPFYNVKLYAIWRANEYTLSYNANTGSGAPVSERHNYRTTFYLSETKPTRMGYTFLGWSEDPSASMPTYASGTSYKMPAYNVTLYAVWQINSFQLIYNANGGNGAPRQEIHNYNETFTLSETKPTRMGYTFLGWSTNASVATATYTSGASYTMPAKDTTLYAIWQVNSWELTYDANGGDGAPEKERRNYNEPFTLSETKPTRMGYTFLGWSTDATATIATYLSGAPYTMPNDNVTLYAVWKIAHIHSDECYHHHTDSCFTISKGGYCNCGGHDSGWQGGAHCKWAEENGYTVNWVDLREGPNCGYEDGQKICDYP